MLQPGAHGRQGVGKSTMRARQDGAFTNAMLCTNTMGDETMAIPGINSTWYRCCTDAAHTYMVIRGIHVTGFSSISYYSSLN